MRRCGNRGDTGRAFRHARAPACRAPRRAGGEPVTLRFVESRPLLDLDTAAEAAVVHRCAPGNIRGPVAPGGSAPGGSAPDSSGRLLVAVDGPLVLVQNSRGLAACLVNLVSRDGPPDFSWSDEPMLQWWASDRDPDFSRPPVTPIEVFSTSTKVDGVVDWVRPTWFWHAFGRVSLEVKELFAVIPDGEAVNVAFGDTGAFALYWSRTVDSPEQAEARPPLSLFARDGAGRVLHSMTLP
ncbi:hypothetical protein [Parafrankia sp. EUN1f]|uniref:hypothetical protein n=1 Tax=Parafrankia sp. EUN1f TaxID=102897 RepID=UPI0001C43F62|nr:hypothetical protein [Parafrankia sp. EUN1f]EFC82547.1 hypothetical protein FrEUN1fDRAFT_4344 [Parafrankia sp. EUN1f]